MVNIVAAFLVGLFYYFIDFLVGLCCGGFYGMTMSITSGIIKEHPWVDEVTWNGEKEMMLGLVSCAVLIGATVGCFFGGFISDWIGPKKALFGSAMLCVVCSGGLCGQKHPALLILLRGIAGLGLGCVSSIGPLYVGEQSPPKYRGTLVAAYQLCLTIGIDLAYVINYVFCIGKVYDGWRWEFLITASFPIGLMIVLLFCPESYGYLQKVEEDRQEKVKFSFFFISIGKSKSS
jgi:MFS family permease